MFNVQKDASYVKKFSANILSGGCAGSLSLLFVYSLDYARTRLANDAKGKGGERQYKGLIDVYSKTLKSDGIQCLYRGFVISCVGIFVYRGMYFGLYDSLKPILLGPDAGLLLSFCLGYGVTVTAGLMSYPIDTIRRRMMMTSGGGVKYKGSIDCAVQIMKNEGFMSMMKALELTFSVVLLALVSSLVSTSSRPCTLRGEPPNKKSSTSATTVSHSFDLQLHCRIKISSCRLLRLYKTMFTSIVSVSDCSNVKINIKK